MQLFYRCILDLAVQPDHHQYPILQILDVSQENSLHSCEQNDMNINKQTIL